MTQISGVNSVSLEARVRPHHGHGSSPRSDDAPMPGERFEKSAPGAGDTARFNALRAQATSASRPYYDAVADAKDRDAYYKGVTDKMAGLSRTDLFDQLSDLVSRTHTTELDYSPSQELYPWVDIRPDGKVKSIYSPNYPETAAPGAAGAPATGPKARLDRMAKDLQDWPTQAAFPGAAVTLGARIAAMDGKHAGYNCEHVVPQSWFDKKLPMRGDLHHLFACDIDWNSTRGSLRYADFPEFDGKPGGPEGKVSGDKERFEPAGGKGAVARATLYFILRYPGQVGDESGEYTASDLKTLVDWARTYPPSDYERHRNQAIFERQGNRNPLIDFPELADRIDFARGLGELGKNS